MSGDCGGTLAVAGFTWERHGDQLMRYMLRVCTACEAADVSALHYINPAYLWCHFCLAQAVEALPAEGGMRRWRCQVCRQVCTDEPAAV